MMLVALYILSEMFTNRAKHELQMQMHAKTQREVLLKVIWEECVATLPRRRMHSPAACASCTMRNVTEPLRNVTERYGTIKENIDFSHH